MWLSARWGGALAPLLVVAALEVMTWRQSFYVFGAIGFVWAYFFFRWFRDLPANHPAVNAAELALLPKTGGGCGRPRAGRAVGRVLRQRIDVAALAPVPLYQLRLLVLRHVASTYIREAFHMKDADRYLAASLAGLPLFMAGISVYLTGKVTPWLVARIGSAARVRRMLGTVGCGIAGLMLLVSITLKDPVWAMAAMGVSCFGNDMVMPGSWTAVMDLGGRFAGRSAAS
jgi:sugar phosphate permease